MTQPLPQEFFEAKEALRRFRSGHGLGATLLESETAVACVKENMPAALLPFMTIENPNWPDVYAFDFSSIPPAVVVWSDHATVERWDSFRSFLRWIDCEEG